LDNVAWFDGELLAVEPDVWIPLPQVRLDQIFVMDADAGSAVVVQTIARLGSNLEDALAFDVGVEIASTEGQE
jgi:hypothetical protein